MKSIDNWRHGPPSDDNIESYDNMIAVVETNGGPQYYLCRLDDNGNLVDVDTGDDYGWSEDSIDRWCPLDEVLSLIGGKDETS